MENGIRACAVLAVLLAGCAIKWPDPLEPRDASADGDVTDGDATLDTDAGPDAAPDADAPEETDAWDDPDADDGADPASDVEEEDAEADIPSDAVECLQGPNVATSATPTSSGGGTDAWGVDQLNNGLYEDTCQFHWVIADSTPGDAYFELEWPSARTLWGMWIDTNHWTNTTCYSPGGVSLAGGTIQWLDWWVGWRDAGVVSGKYDDWGFEFDPPVTTTSVRIYGAHATDMGGQTYNPLIYEWEVFECAP
jgi:hypothetical protein